jgi:hypothetical protein
MSVHWKILCNFATRGYLDVVYTNDKHANLNGTDPGSLKPKQRVNELRNVDNEGGRKLCLEIN